MSHKTPSHDTLFLRCYANLRRRSPTLAGTMPLMVVAPLVLILALILWLGKVQLQQDVAQQADRVGSTLARQIAASAAEPLAANRPASSVHPARGNTLRRYICRISSPDRSS